MWIKEKRVKLGIFLIILLTGVFLGGVIIYYSNGVVTPGETNAINTFYNSDKMEVALFYNLSETVENATDVFIRWWNKPETNEYYFFLPESMRDKKLYWIFSKKQDIYINDSKIEEYSIFNLAEGEYSVRIEEQEKETYIMNVMYSSPVATFFFETESGALDFLHESKENRETGKYLLLNADGKLENAGLIRNIHGRGNNAWVEYEKKSYQVTLEEKASLLSMPQSRKWLLISNAPDDTLMRNKTAYTISEDLGFEFTPKMEYTEVYANGNYLGLYCLTEKVEIDKERVDIRDLEKEMEKLNNNIDFSTCEIFMEEQGRLYSTKGYRIENQPADISGGYLLELELLDRYGLEASGFITSRMQGVVFKSPEYASYEQVSYIANLYQDFEDAIYSKNGYSPYTGRHFTDYIDTDSFASKYLLEELVKNLDASYTSQFFYKPDGSISDKFFAGPVWDYDKAIASYGITEAGIDLHIPEQMYVSTQKDPGDIWYGLCQHESFMNVVKEKYKLVLLDSIKKITEVTIPETKEGIYKSAKSNMIRWNTYAHLESIEERVKYYDEKIEEQKEFLLKRMEFLKNEWGI